MNRKFNRGDEVQRVSDPLQIGTVVEVLPLHAEMQYYRINLGGGKRPVIPEVDLRPYRPANSPYDNLENGNIDGYQQFQRLITFQRLLRDHPLRNNIYAFNASRTRFFPYQFKPLIKFLDSPKSRLLIADEVGLGKTIEAGLILTELRARKTVRKVLVVCPANLTGKWQLELKKRFGEKFTLINSKQFRNFLDEYEGAPEDTEINGIISLESLRQRQVLEQLEAISPNFNLVIIDEAHHMRNFGRKQRKAGVLLGQNADAMIFLTATPVHLGSENLYSLLNILDEEEFPDLYTVDDRFRKNEPIIKAQICLGQIPPNLEQAAELINKASEYAETRINPALYQLKDVFEQLETIDKKNTRGLLIDAQRELAELNLIGHIFTRTKKRDAQTHMAVRKAYPIRLSFSELEMDFYNTVTAYVCTEIEQRINNPLIKSWILNTPQRRMASSIPAMVEFYKENLDIDEVDGDDSIFLSDDVEEATLKTLDLAALEKRLREIIRTWPSDANDSKYQYFRDILKNLKRKEKKVKVMVFAFFKGTLKYLYDRLHRDGFNALLISGDVHPDARTEIVDKFKNEIKYEVLLSSRVGSEGLDFQFCDTLFNYDLPWNPMEVEQRIGRLDRIGQASEVIRIYNFWIENTIEERILDRLYKRIGIFEKSVGELEMILGDELGSFESDILSKSLSKEERIKLIDRKAIAIDKRLAALKELENEAAQFIGTDQFFNEEVKLIGQRRRYVTGEQLRKFIVDFLKHESPNSRLEYDQKVNIGKLYPDNILNSIIVEHHNRGGIAQYFNTGRRGIAITFDSQTAFENPNVDFINVLHPLTQAIVKHYERSESLQSNVHHVVLNTTILSEGLYLYFVNRIRIKAARSNNILEMVVLDQNLEIPCDDEEAETLLGEMVENGSESLGVTYDIDPAYLIKAYENATKIFQDKLMKTKHDTEKNNDRFIERRLESLRTSYNKNIKMKNTLLEGAVEKQQKEKYLRMLRGTIKRLESELSEKETQIERTRAVQVEYDEISAGILEIIP